MTAPRQSPYQGLAPYREADAEWFFGRDEWCDVIGDNLRAYRITVLYGMSGVGKSSVLRAGLLRRLADEARANAAVPGAPRLLPVVFSSWSVDEPAAALQEAVATAAAGGVAPDGGGDGVPEGSLADALAAWPSRIEGPLLLVLDQLEELFVYHDRPGDPALEELGAALRRRDPALHWLLSIREDALAKLDRFEGRVSGLLDHLLRLEPLDRDAAREAIVVPLEQWNRKLAAPGEEVEAEPELVEAVLEQVAAGKVSLVEVGAGRAGGGADEGIDAPYLQLVLTRLWDEEQRAAVGESRRLRRQTLDDLGGAERIVRTHLDAAMAGIPSADQDVAMAIFNYLVTPSGTKIAHRPSDLAAYASLAEPDVATVLDRLCGGDARILRPAGDGTYEIYHDVLAAPILDWRARHALAKAEAVRERKRRRRRRILLAAGVPAVLAAIAVPLAFWRLQADKTADTQQRLLVAEAKSAPNVLAVLAGHKNAAEDARFSPDGRHIVSASDDGTARVWSAVPPYRPLAVLRAERAVAAASFSPDGKLVVTASKDGNASVWDWSRGRVVAALHTDAGLDDAEFSPDGRRVVVAADDGLARVWDLSARRVLAKLEAHGVARSATFSPDGRLVATASDDGRVRVSQWETGITVVALQAGKVEDTAYDASFNRDGRLLVTADQDGTARVWDLRGYRQLAVLHKGAGGIRTAAFSPDGRLVVTNGPTGDAQVWDWRARRILTELKPGGAESAEFSPNGRTIVTAEYSGFVRIWHVVRPDLTLVHLRWRGPSSGLVRFRVQNVGDATTRSTKVLVRGPRFRKTAAVPALLPNAGKSFAITVPSTERLSATVDPEKTVPERSFRNNTVGVSVAFVESGF